MDEVDMEIDSISDFDDHRYNTLAAAAADKLTISTPPTMRRGPMYSAYAELRESSLRRKKKALQYQTSTHALASDERSVVSLSPSVPTTRRSLLLTQSVNDLSPLLLRKENRKPPLMQSPAAAHYHHAFKMDALVTPPRVRKTAELRRSVAGTKNIPVVRRSYSCLRGELCRGM